MFKTVVLGVALCAVVASAQMGTQMDQQSGSSQMGGPAGQQQRGQRGSIVPDGVLSNGRGPGGMSGQDDKQQGGMGQRGQSGLAGMQQEQSGGFREQRAQQQGRQRAQQDGQQRGPQQPGPQDFDFNGQF